MSQRLPPTDRPHTSLLRNRGVAAGLLALAALTAVVHTLNDPGPAWDEPTYSSDQGPSQLYTGWLLAPSLSRDAIDAAWRPNHEHPPLAKVWMGLARRALQAMAPDLSDLSASRFAAALLFAALVGLVSLAAWPAGPPAGVAAGVFALLMPRLFADAHFAALDVPVALAWFAAPMAFRRGIGSRGWAAAAGVIFGLALLTKISAVFIPLPLVAWAALAHRRRAVVPALMLVGIGGAVFLAGWPWLWHDTLPRLGEYLLGTTLGRAVVPVYYLGTVYAERHAPWHYPLVMAAFTIPAGILLCAVLGAARSVGRGERAGRLRSFGALTLFNAGAILLVAALPGAPTYDGVRLFLPLFPFAAVLAGVGFQRLWDWWRPRRSRLALACAFVASQAAGIAIYHPFETSYFNLLCGGLPGAARIGLETTYWDDACNDEVFNFIRALPPGSRVAFFPVNPFLELTYRETEGCLPDSIVYADFEKDAFDYAVLVNRQGMLLQNERAAVLFARGRRLLDVKRLGVTLCTVVAAER